MAKYSSIYFTLILTVFICITAYSQYPRQANLAIIETHRSNNRELLKDCASVLKKDGYEICHFEPDNMMLTTNSYFIGELPLLVYYKITISGNFILLRGYVMNLELIETNEDNTRTGQWDRSSFRSFTGSTWQIGFKDMVFLTEKIRSAIYGKVRWGIEEGKT